MKRSRADAQAASPADATPRDATQALQDARDDEALLARVKHRVLRAIAGDDPPGCRTVRAPAGDWESVGPGVERKILSESPTGRASMWRLAPGAVVGAHRHVDGDEECMVLEGSLQIGADLLLRAGDFHVACRGSHHDAATTASGAILYIRDVFRAPPL